jgi:hypothetical protein
MRASLVVSAVLGLALSLIGCTVIDLRLSPSGARSDAFISGYADAGWPASDSLVKVGLFKGPTSRGSVLYLQLWKLLRFELGFLGVAAGIGPLDAGIGVLFYEPRPPVYEDHGDEACDECEDCDEPGHRHSHDDAEDDDEDAATAGDDGDSVQTFVYQAF